MGKKPAPVVKVSSGSREWVAPSGSHWMVDTYWSLVDGRQECVGVTLRSFGYLDEELNTARPVRLAEGVQALRVEVLRALTMGVVEEQRAGFVQFLDFLGDNDELRATFATGKTKRITNKSGALLTPAEVLIEVAKVYQQAHASGQSPTVAVAKAFSLSRSAAAKRVARARSAGLLPTTTRGQARGEST